MTPAAHARPFPAPAVYYYTTDEGIPLDVYYEYDPAEPAVFREGAECAPVPECVHIYKITVGNVDIGVDRLKALMGKKWEPWLNDLETCIKQQENERE